MAINNVVLTGISSTSPPGVFVELDFAQGQAGAPTQVYSVLILANFTSAGSISGSFTAGQVFGPDTLTPMQTVQDAANLFGAGSPAHLMVSAFKSVNTTTPLYVAPVSVATGTAATLSFTVSTSAGQTSGVIQLAIDGKAPVQAVFGATDTANTIATNLANAVNGNINLPVTASASTGSVKLTAKVAGSRGNDIRAYAQVVSGSGVAVTNNSPVFMSGGAGSDATNYTATLNALATNGQRYYYYVCEAGWDNADGYTNGIPALVQAQIDALALPAVGLRQRAIFGSNDTLANTAAVSTTINDPRLEVVWCKNLDLTPGELASYWAAAVTLTESVPLSAQSVNFDGFGSDAGSKPFWHVSAPKDGTAPSSTDIQTAVVSGVTPLQVGPGGTTKVVKRVTSRYFTLGGAGGNQQVLDLRITDAGQVTICDRFFDDLQAVCSLRFPRMLIGNDPANGSPPAPAGVCTPSKMRDTVVEVIKNYASAGLIQYQQTLAGLVVQRNNNPASSMGVLVPLFVNDLLHQTLIKGLQLNAIVI